MIIKMTRVRILGAKRLMTRILHELQTLECVHLKQPRSRPGLDTYTPPPQQQRTVQHLQQLLEDVERSLAIMKGHTDTPARRPATIPRPRFPEWARLARKVRQELEELSSQKASLEEEKVFINKYRLLIRAFQPFLDAEGRLNDFKPFYLLLRADQSETVSRLRGHLQELIPDAFELRTNQLATGDTALLLLVASHQANVVDEALQRANIEPIPVPAKYGGGSLMNALPAMRQRAGEIPTELAKLDRRLRHLTRTNERQFVTIAAATRDRLLELSALTQASVTPRAFVLEGWVPTQRLDILREALSRFGHDATLELVSTEEWSGEETPVVLSNPRLFRPFQVLTSMLPLPRYGTIDPTPFVAIFFPAFFGIVLGDVGYGAMLGTIGLVLRFRSRPDSLWRSVAEIAMACALCTIVFGVLYGEVFGDLGTRVLGIHALWMNREESIVPFLILAVGLGVAHIVLGLVVGAATSFKQDRRKSIGRGLAAAIVLLIVFALLTALNVLPHKLFTPAVIAILILFPIMTVLEGFLAPLELMSTLGNMLSYARIMALGTASVMMAVAANRLAGALGPALVGVVFALLFHLVNFVIGVFSPTIHVMRLHYVEFFGKFYSPGGTPYKPFGLWHPHENSGRA